MANASNTFSDKMLLNALQAFCMQRAERRLCNSAAGPGVWVLIMLLYFAHLSSALESAGNQKDARP